MKRTRDLSGIAVSALRQLGTGEVARTLPPVDDDKENSAWETSKSQEVILDLSEARSQEEIIG